MIKDRKFSTGQPARAKQNSKPNFNPNSKPNSYEKLRERLSQRSQLNTQSLQEFELELSQLGLVQKFKKIVSEYYHIILAVHAVTSAGWVTVAFLIKYQL